MTATCFVCDAGEVGLDPAAIDAKGWAHLTIYASRIGEPLGVGELRWFCPAHKARSIFEMLRKKEDA